MDDINNNSAESGENTVANPIPPHIFLIMEGVKAIPLNNAHITVGRSHDNMIVLDDPRVSRFHAELRVIRGNFVIFDLNSSGGTYLNGQRTNQGILYPGDLISLAGVNLVFTQDTRLIGDKAKPLVPEDSGKRSTVIFKKSILPKDEEK